MSGTRVESRLRSKVARLEDDVSDLRRRLADSESELEATKFRLVETVTAKAKADATNEVQKHSIELLTLEIERFKAVTRAGTAKAVADQERAVRSVRPDSEGPVE